MKILNMFGATAWSWSYGSWVYNYICNTGTCFIQKIYAPSSSLTQALVSFKKYMPPALPYTKEEQGAYIFWMKQVYAPCSSLY
jgi:hypothetical protein